MILPPELPLASRYQWWREACRVREGAPLRRTRAVPLAELQALWRSGEFGRDFLSTTGGRVRVERFGEWNAGPGPHFTGAEVRFGGAPSDGAGVSYSAKKPAGSATSATSAASAQADPGMLVRGGIEVHWDAAEWLAHAAASPDYEGAILHVFASDAGRERGAALPATCTALGREVPQVWLDAGRFEWETAEPGDPPPGEPTPCQRLFAGLPVTRILELVEAAAQYRLCRKAARLARWADAFDPREALYQGVAEALGYRHNKLPFLLLAQRLPLALLQRRRPETEMLLFAGSGFLNVADLGVLPPETRAYLRGVWEQWWPRRTEFERLVVEKPLWSAQSTRPVNHPQRRVAALAEIAKNWPAIETLAHSCRWGSLRKLLGRLEHPYWERHFTLTSRTARSRMALVGEARAVELLVNVFMPGAIRHAAEFWDTYRAMPAAASNQRVQLAGKRLFGDFGNGALLAGMEKQAMMQQGLLQLFEDFCVANEADCARCEMCGKIAQWQAG